MSDYLFIPMLVIAFVYSILDVKKQYYKYKEVRKNDNLDKYAITKILVTEVGIIIIGVVALIAFLVVPLITGNWSK